MIQIAIANANNFLRKGLIELLNAEEGLSVIFDAENCDGFLSKMEVSLPDVCLIDIVMQGASGYELVEIVRSKYSSVRILAISMFDSEYNIIKMLRAGANGYLVMTDDVENLKIAIKEVFKNGFFHNNVVTGRMLYVLHDSNSLGKLELNDRECQFLRLCCSGLTYKEIADRMFLSPMTVWGYRESIAKKLNIRTRQEMVMFAIKAGIGNV